MKVCVTGLGTVGFPTAKYISRYHEVVGYDIDYAQVKVANDYFPAFKDWNQVPECDVYVVSVNTWWRGCSDMSAVEDVCRKILLKTTEKSPLICIESTVSIGTSRRIWTEIFKKEIPLAYCPHRYWRKDPIHHGVRQPRVLGDLLREGVQGACNFYSSIEIPFLYVDPIEIAELSKIVENSYNYVKIAFSEEIRLLCEDLSLDWNRLREACNTKWNIDLPEARDGISGSCYPKDIRFLIDTGRKSKIPLLKAAVQTNEYYKRKEGK